MNSSQLLGFTTFAYLLSAVIYIALLIFRNKRLGPVATGVTLVALSINVAGIAFRWIESHQMGIGYAPLSNMYESLVFFSASIAAFYLYIEFKYKNRLLGSFSMPFAFLSMAYASFATEFGKEIKALVPALQSNWLISHVVTCFIGYAAFTIACGMGIMYLIKSRQRDNLDKGILGRLPSLEIIDEINHKTQLFGFLWLTIGIITGAVWANSAWGTYWSWDPKETWSLITWFIYAASLHAHLTKGWRGKRIAWLSIIGFAAVLFTYYGVNFLLSGLHSYG